MYLSKASTYGIRSVAYIASKRERAVISVRELSQQLQIPAAFLTKIMQRLATRGIVITMRGFGGGITLGKPAAEITLKDVITAIDGDESFPYFWLGIPDDQLKQIPEFHKKWLDLINSIDSFFSNTRLIELGPRNLDNSVGPDNDIKPDNSAREIHSDLTESSDKNQAPEISNAAKLPSNKKNKPSQ